MASYITMLVLIMVFCVAGFTGAHNLFFYLGGHLKTKNALLEEYQGMTDYMASTMAERMVSRALSEAVVSGVVCALVLIALLIEWF